MTKFYFSLTFMCLMVLGVFGQTSLVPQEGYVATTWLPEYPGIVAFDLLDTLVYLSEGDTIYMLDISTGTELKKFGLPEDYTGPSYASFLTVSPDGKFIWAGYTSDGNLDDRIYTVEVKSGEWELQALFPGNMDLVFWNDSILVSGLNSSLWDAPSSVFVLDTSGRNQHRRIIEIGGYSAGLAVDEQGNLYYGTSLSGGANAIYRWDSSVVQSIIEVPGETCLDTTQGVKLTGLPAGAYDCEVDEGGNVLFNMNLYGGTMVVGMWNGIPGDGYNIDTLATAAGEWDWLGVLKSGGNINKAGPGNMVVTYSFGGPLTVLTRENTLGKEIKSQQEWGVFPNPSPGIFRISSDGAERMDVKVFTMQGALVFEKQDFMSGAVLDINSRPAGFYVVSVCDGNMVRSKIIQKL